MSWIVSFSIIALINFLCHKVNANPVNLIVCVLSLLMAGEGVIALYLQYNYWNEYMKVEMPYKIQLEKLNPYLESLGINIKYVTRSYYTWKQTYCEVSIPPCEGERALIYDSVQLRDIGNCFIALADNLAKKQEY